MNVILMMHEIGAVPNPMIGKPALPDFLIAANDRPKLMRVSTFYQLDRAFNRKVVRGSQQDVDQATHRSSRI